MLRTILIYGAIAGLIVGLPMFLLSATFKNSMIPHGMLIGYTTMLVAFSMIFFAIKRRRDRDLGGVIRFWPALGLGLGITCVAGILYVASWDLGLAISHADFAGVYADAVIKGAQAKGTSGPELDKLIAEMNAFRVQYADPLWRWPMTFMEIAPVGLLVSLVSAALLRNSRFLPARA